MSSVATLILVRWRAETGAPVVGVRRHWWELYLGASVAKCLSAPQLRECGAKAQAAEPRGSMVSSPACFDLYEQRTSVIHGKDPGLAVVLHWLNCLSTV